MRANRKYLNSVEKKLSTMTLDKQYSYLRGAVMVKGNSATTLELERMLEKVKDKRLGS